MTICPNAGKQCSDRKYTYHISSYGLPFSKEKSCLLIKKLLQQLFELATIKKKKISGETKVCFIKICSNLSSVLLVCLLRIFMKQMLYEEIW